MKGIYTRFHTGRDSVWPVTPCVSYLDADEAPLANIKIGEPAKSLISGRSGT